MGDLTPEELEALLIVARTRRDPLCPSCGRRYVDPSSKNGWCQKCDDDRERMLEAKRRWWHENGRRRDDDDDA